jgi:stringent starvation protein B
MSEMLSTKPYLIRAIHEWCIDAGFTPHLLVVVNAQTRVPLAYVKNGEIVLNLNYAATRDLQIEADAITFSARFGGVSHHLYVPVSAVRGIYARENGQGMFFDVDPQDGHPEDSESKEKDEEIHEDDKKVEKIAKKPALKLVK